ncbi:unnamed protein product [Brachionus calyciflorus]|uniref:HAT C-terminal dimerisation domain-containing protein n=1 Tax=Brachionus calyciflorus TaxID=104777 RepID=A0A813SNW3_9BILA|nr:unnamed protein product [Brachionus calyciflorus]
MHEIDEESINNSDINLNNERVDEPFENEYNQVAAEVAQITNEVNSIVFAQIVEKAQRLGSSFLPPRLRLENTTRWSSAYLMLESVLRAYSKNLFVSENPDLRCPVSGQNIEIYLQILKPAYILNINFQNNHSSIADTTIGVLKLLDTFRRMVLDPVPRRLANLLIQTINRKFEFEFELQSPIYQVSGLKMWVSEPWTNNLFTKGLSSLKNIGSKLLEVHNESENQPRTQSRTIQIDDSPSTSFYAGFFSAEHNRPINNLSDEIFKHEIENEVNKLKAILTADNNKLILTTTNSKEFWYQHQGAFAKLSKLANILLNINSSSACVERFFSLCGFIENKRNQNMETELFINR